MQTCFESLLGVSPQNALLREACDLLKSKPFVAEKEDEPEEKEENMERKNEEDENAAAPLANAPEKEDGTEHQGGTPPADSQST